MQPKITLIPLREVVASDVSTTLDVIVRIESPQAQQTLERPKLNLGLVIDHSGSMQGQKMDYARKAAIYAVEQLKESDRVSVTIYDDQVKVIVPSTLATNKAEIIRQIKRIHSGGRTALHAGWVEGSLQVSHHLNSEQLNRVILLSDGLANAGETNPDVICSNVHGLMQHGVSTTTMGIGNDFNEDLMEAMAKSGDGNYYYIESPDLLPTIFQAELQGIMATVGSKVSLGIEPSRNVQVLDVFNDLSKTMYERYKLPNLIMGNNIDVVVRLKIPPINHTHSLCKFRLAWDTPEQIERQELKVALKLPVVASTQLDEFPFNIKVTERVAQLIAVRAREEAVQNLDRGDYSKAKRVLNVAQQELLAAPMSEEMKTQELAELKELDQQLERGDHQKMRKQASYESYRKRSSRPE